MTIGSPKVGDALGHQGDLFAAQPPSAVTTTASSSPAAAAAQGPLIPHHRGLMGNAGLVTLGRALDSVKPQARGHDSRAWGLTAMPSGRRPLGEQVAHRTRLTAEEVAEERVNAREASLAGGQVEPEHEPGHGLRGALRDLLGHPLVVV
jgi:hypothetical protein